MSIQFKFPSENEAYDASTACMVGMALVVMDTMLPLLFGAQFITTCAVLFPSSTNNTTTYDDLWRCDIPFDTCRCSVLSNRSDTTQECLTEFETMTAHIYPLAIYILQLYVIYNLFSFTGKYRHILTDIFWIIAFVIFIVVAIAAHRSDCFYYRVVFTICATGIVLAALPVSLFLWMRDKNGLCERSNIYSDQQLSMNNHEQINSITITLL